MITCRAFALRLAVVGLAGLTSCSAQERDFGSGGTGAAGGSSGTSDVGTGTATTTSTGVCADVEDCWNGVDDDCDGALDCADPDCAEGAVCVTAPTNFELGVVVGASDACPDGFTADETLIYRGLGGGGCEGCGCTPNPTDCKADLYLYASAAECNGDTGGTGGVYAGRYGFACDGMPINDGFVQWGGVRASTFIVEQSCTSTGTAVPAPARWGEEKKFCRAAGPGKGCSAGQACVPKQQPSAQCALVSGSATCDGYAKRESDWFRGYDDSRTCSSCACVASGGDCNYVDVELGNDYSCFEHARINQGGRYCDYAYSPPAHLIGTPSPSTCTSRTNLTGSLDPTGQSTLCCIE